MDRPQPGSPAWARLAAALGVCLVLAACGSGDQGGGEDKGFSPNPGGTAQSTSTTGSASLVGNGPVTLPDLPREGKVFQKEILADGKVTEAEYERAVLAKLRCVVDAGLSYHDLHWRQTRNHRVLSYYVSGHPPGFEPGLSPNPHDECWAEYSRAVEGAWSTQHAPTEAEEQAMRQAFVECLRSDGVDVASYEDAVERRMSINPQTLRSCMISAFRLLG